MSFAVRSSWLVILGFIVIGCGYPKGGSVPGPVSPALLQQAQTRFPEASDQSLTQGRELFVGNCERCHKLPDRRAVSEEAWPKILNRMAKKAKLDDAQHKLVLQFIVSERSQPVTAQ